MVTVSLLGIILYVGFVVTGTLLVGILPPLVNLPQCEPKTNYRIDKLDVQPLEQIENKIAIREKRQVDKKSRSVKILDDPNEKKWNNQYQFYEENLKNQNPLFAKYFRSKNSLTRCPEVNNTRPGDTYPWTGQRIPDNVKPINYDVEFILNDFGLGAYLAYIEITFEVSEPVDYIILHSAENDIPVASDYIYDKDKNNISVACTSEYTAQRRDFYVIKSEKTLMPANNPYIISFLVRDLILNAELGIFKLDYGGTAPMTGSKFEPVDARRAYPVFDEPNLKATYNVRIYHSPDFEALSNMPVKEFNVTSEFPNLAVTTFEMTPKLPSYLMGYFAFSKNDFKKLTTNVVGSNGPILLNLWARNDFIDKGFADDTLTMCVDILTILLDIFKDVDNTALPTKIDVFAIPDYPADSIGHYGLAVFKENKILFKQTTASERDKQNVASLIAQTFAQFWFGNFVTMKWWDELWLQEGFSNYIKYKVLEQGFPDWKTSQQVITDDLIPTLISDGYPSSHPIFKNISNPYEIEEFFDDIETLKSAIILRWVEAQPGIGLPKMYQAITNYLNANKWGLGDIDIFYQSLGTISQGPKNWPAKDFYDRWILQPNYPVVYAEILSTTTPQQVRFNQYRALNSNYSIFAGELFYPSSFGWIWYVPTKCELGTSSNEGDPTQIIQFYIDQRTETFDLPIASNGQPWVWINCNKGFEGYFELQYPKPNWDFISQSLENKITAVASEDRACIIHNLFLNAFSERGNYFTVSEALDYLTDELEYLPWRAAYIHIKQLASVLQYRKAYYEISTFFSGILENIEDKIDIWTPTGDHLQDLLKETIGTLACYLQDYKCLIKTGELWETVKLTISNGNFEQSPVPAYAREIVYNYHIQNTYDVGDWNQILIDYVKIIDESEQRKLLEALTFTKLTWLLDKVCQDRNAFKKVDFFDIFRLLGDNVIGREIAWYYVQLNLVKIYQQFTKDDPRIGQMIIDIVKTFENEFLFFELLDFVYPLTTGAISNARYKSLEYVSTNILWYYDKEQELIDAFSPVKRYQTLHSITQTLTDTTNKAASSAFKRKANEALNALIQKVIV